jgi:hypothetical protein
VLCDEINFATTLGNVPSDDVITQGLCKVDHPVSEHVALSFLPVS